jgi:hypothetical protein
LVVRMLVPHQPFKIIGSLACASGSYCSLSG